MRASCLLTDHAEHRRVWPPAPGRATFTDRMIAGQALLAIGLAALALGMGLVAFVMIGLLGLLLVAASLPLLLTAGFLICDPSLRRWRTLPGLVLFVAGAGGLVYAAGEATMAADHHVRHARLLRQPELDPGPAPTAAVWPWLMIVAPAAAGVLALGLRMRTAWPAFGLLCWLAAALAVCPTAVGLFHLLAPFLPLDA